jgi:hypothetical protein
MPFALKARWEVNAGVVPGIGIAKFTKRYEYTSDDHEKDSLIKEPQDVSIFAKLRAEAMDYYLQISLPQINNWATIRFTWY